MDKTLSTKSLDTTQYLAVRDLLIKLASEPDDGRICVCIEAEETPTSPITLLISRPDGTLRELFVWVPTKLL